MGFPALKGSNARSFPDLGPIGYWIDYQLSFKHKAVKSVLTIYSGRKEEKLFLKNPFKCQARLE